MLWFQSTHPQGVRLFDFIEFPVRYSVSIHAPAGGATRGKFSNSFNKQVSIHAPAGGATIYSWFLALSNTYGFNPRTRRGCDRSSPISSWLTRLVSIHAPAGGATTCRPKEHALRGVSIHAPAGGATLVGAFLRYTAVKFQSTHPQGVRRMCVLLMQTGILFQSTHPQGVRPAARHRHNLRRQVSIHAPAGGATSRNS